MNSMDKLDLNLMPIALALYDELSVSRAAQKLGMSQPAVSMALRRMRTAFNDPLFIRAPRGVTPTPRAHALVRAVRPVVAHLQDALRTGETFHPQLDARPFSFALSDVGEMVFLPRLLERLRALASNSMIRSLSMPPSQLAQDLESGEVDLAIGYFPDLLVPVRKGVAGLDCPIPDFGGPWLKTLPPVFLPQWPFADSEASRFTSIMRWQNSSSSASSRTISPA